MSNPKNIAKQIVAKPREIGNLLIEAHPLLNVAYR